jgi:hypothetical protein
MFFVNPWVYKIQSTIQTTKYTELMIKVVIVFAEIELNIVLPAGGAIV